jgi:molybdenum cofactor synthesis domain-containing protein
MMITVEEAIRNIVEEVRPLSLELVDISAALGRVLAEDIIADSDLPPFNRAQMDGFAIRATDASNPPVRLRIVGESAAGRGWPGTLKAGEAVRIMTGAPVPSGADCVQKVEVTHEADGFVEILEAPNSRQFIVDRATEIRSGQVVLQKGTLINAAMMAALAAFGYARIQCYRRPKVAVLATGSELVRVSDKPGTDQIRDSNSLSIGAYAELAGAIIERLPLAGDDPELLKRTILDAALRSDVLVLSGGVSMGVYDFTKPALKEVGAEIYFERVSLRPGKPTVFARLGQTYVFGLPGNPVSVSVTFNLFARTALLALQGCTEPGMEEWTAVLSHGVKGAVERTSYLPAELKTGDDGRLMAVPLKWGGSSDFVAFTRATALIIIPAGVPFVEADTPVRIVRLP